MNANQIAIRHFMSQIPTQAMMVRDKPVVPDLATRILRARLMLEEVMETINHGLGLDIVLGMGKVITYDQLHMVVARDPNMVEIADGLADCEYVQVGTAIAVGIDHQRIFEIVHNNNMKKLGTGTIDEFGKLVKSPTHVGPEREIIAELERQQW